MDVTRICPLLDCLLRRDMIAPLTRDLAILEEGEANDLIRLCCMWRLPQTPPKLKKLHLLNYRIRMAATQPDTPS